MSPGGAHLDADIEDLDEADQDQIRGHQARQQAGKDEDEYPGDEGHHAVESEVDVKVRALLSEIERSFQHRGPPFGRISLIPSEHIERGGRLPSAVVGPGPTKGGM